ncbi:MAG: hypothetical protein U9P14_06545, partial [Gemmatimonadota bacterium]|nr:hypothetical protein [Gemmatimonadota bacterium]
GVRTKSLPEPDDEFARSVSPDDDMEGLKLKLRQELEADVAQRANRVVEELLFRQIIEVNPFEVPSSMVEMVIGQRLKNASQQYPNQDFDQDEFAQAARPSAEYGVKREYVIQEIIKKEQLEVEQAEIEAKIEEFAGQVGKSIDEIRKDFRSPEAAGRLGSLILEEKTVKFLMENNDIQEVEE